VFSCKFSRALNFIVLPLQRRADEKDKAADKLSRENQESGPGEGGGGGRGFGGSEEEGPAWGGEGDDSSE
jgi:hypothetical protein